MIKNLLRDFGLLLLGKVYAIDANNPTPPTIPGVLTSLLPTVNGLLFGVAPVLLVVFIVFAGIKRLMAADNAKAVQEANQTIFWAVIGYAVVLLSYLIVRLGLSVIGFDITTNDDIVL